MSASRQTASVPALGRLFGEGTLAGMNEGQLLERFASVRDELAFAALVERLGPMVAGVCRRKLADPRDVEDAFQATFLVLIRKAGSIRESRLVGSWLYGVATRVATRARAHSFRRKGREAPWVEMAGPGQPDGDLLAALDEEIARLPEKYRRPLVLCYLEGLTHEEAAERLRCPVGTVRSRMAWARDRLRSRLGRAGATVPSGLAVAAEATAMTTPVPRGLLESTVRLASESSASLARNVSAHVVGLSQGVIRTMMLTNVRSALVLSAALVLGAGGLAMSQQSRKEGGGTIPKERPQADAIADPLIAGWNPFPGTGGVGMPIVDPSQFRKKSYGQTAHLIVSTSPAKDRVWGYSVDTGNWNKYSAPEGTTIVPVFGGATAGGNANQPGGPADRSAAEVVALDIRGDHIGEIAAFSSKSGAWRICHLKKPVKGPIPIVVAGPVAVYFVGRELFAYSAEADMWGGIKLSEWEKYTPNISPHSVVVEQGDKVRVFNVKTGLWSMIDVGK